MSGATLVVVGIGADGWTGLAEPARAAVLGADEIVGAQRQLALLPPQLAARAHPWPSPIGPLVDELVARPDGSVCVLASGDPMLHGIGATLARRVEPSRLRVHPHPSAFALACARLGWPAAEVELVSAVARPADVIARVLAPGRRAVAFVAGGDGATEVAQVLRGHGYGASRLVVLEQLGGPDERIHDATADGWDGRAVDALHVVAIACRASADALVRSRVPGLPDAAFESDGQLTKRHVRALAVTALAPGPGELLWDVGAGSGSIAVEWLRIEPTARAIAVERRGDRAERIARNALRLGVPELEVRVGAAPDALDGLERPDAIFVGGGVGAAGLLERCWAALDVGGRIVAHAVTLEGEQALVAARARLGGELVRIALAHAEPLGALTAWRPQLPIVQWSARREGA